MRRILFSRNDWMQEAGVALSGGRWRAASPLANILDYRPQFVAEAFYSTWAATTFDVDLGVSRRVGLFHFQQLRASANGLMRLRAGTDPTFATSLYDTGEVSCYPTDSVAPGYTPWGVWTLSGAIDDEEYLALGMPRFFIPSAPVWARYIRVEVKDHTARERLQIGCFGACEVWEPALNFSYDWNITPVDEADVQRVPFGSSYLTLRGKRRRLNLGFNALPEAEVKSRSLGLSLLKGKSQSIVVVPFPEDRANLEKIAVYGLVSNDSQISNPYFARYAHPFQIEQLI